MPVYIVAFEPSEPTRDYDEFHSALGDYSGQQLLDRVYLVEAPTDADTLRRHLSALASHEDRLWISRVTEDHSGFVMEPAAEWLDQRKPL